jgi:hypothetical protein
VSEQFGPTDKGESGGAVCSRAYCLFYNLQRPVGSSYQATKARAVERYVPGPTAYILHVLFQGPFGERGVRTDGQGLERRSGMFQVPLPIFLHALFQGPLGERAVRTDGQRPGAEDVMFQGPLSILHLLFQGPLHVLHVLFQGPLGERAARTDGQGLEQGSSMFQGQCLFYMCYSRAYLVSEQFIPRDKGESGGMGCSRAHCLYSTCVIPGPTW